MLSDDFEKVKREINLVDYIVNKTGGTAKQYGDTWRIKPCPVCGDDKYKHFNIDVKDGIWLFNDFASGLKGSIIDFNIEVLNATDTQEALNMALDYIKAIPNNFKSKYGKPKDKGDIKDTAIKDYDFKELADQLKINLSKCDYFKNRGLDAEGDSYILGYSPEGYNSALKEKMPELRNFLKDSKEKYIERQYKHFIFFKDSSGKYSYFIARIDDESTKDISKEILDSDYPKFLNLKSKVVGPIKFFNERYFMDPSLSSEYVFIVESITDALSLESLGYNAMAINSASNAKKVLEIIKANKKNLDNKVLIVAGDKDAAGNKMNTTLTQGFDKMRIHYNTFIIPQAKDFNQWLNLDRQGLEAYLKDYINNPNIPQESNSEHAEEPPHISGIFEYNNCYCKWTGKGDDFKLKEITNFVIEPLELISMDDNAMEISTNIITKNGKVFKRTLNISDLMGGFQRFKKALRQLLIFDGKDGELEAIKKIILSTPFKNKTGVTHTGFHYINKKWVYVSGNKAIDQDLNTIEDTVMLKGSLRLDTSLLNVDPINKQELTLLASKLLRFNDISKTSTIIGHTAALFLKEKLWANNINFNHLLVIGEAGSGKSQTVRYIISPLVGIIQRPMDAGNCTKFAIIKTAASSNTMPFIIEEYKPSKIGKFIINEISEFLRNSYDHYQAIRGNADQGINEYDMLTPAILVGEDSTDETAIIERSLLVSFSKIESLEDKHTNAFMFLKENGELLNKLGRALLNEALKIDVDDVKRIHDKYANDIVTKDITSTRIVNSVANAMTGITLLKKVFDSVGVDFALIGYSPKQIFEGINKAAFTDLLNENKTSKTAVDLAIEIFDRMANPAVNKIWEGIHFKANPDEDELALDVTGIYDIFRKYVSEYKITECEELTKNQFTKQLRKSPYFKDYKPVRFYSDGVRNKSVLKRAFTLSIKELELKGLDLNYMHQVKEAMSEAAVTA